LILDEQLTRRSVLDAEAVTHLDSTGLDALHQLTDDLEADEITLVVARLRTRVEEQFESAAVTETIGLERFYPTVRAGVKSCVRGQSRRQ
jgi:anti-anti-sigma regulatory factor